MIRNEDSRSGFPSTCDRAKKSTTPLSIRSLSTCDKESKNRSPHRVRSLSACDKNNKKKNPSLMTRNEDGRRSSPESKQRKVNEESRTSGGIDSKSDDSGKKTIRKHLHVRAYKKILTKHAKAGGNHGGKYVKDKSSQQGYFMNLETNSSKEVKVSGDVGMMKEGVQDEIELRVETTESLEKIDSKNKKLSELCNHDPSEINVDSPVSMLEKVGVGDGGINKKQISAEKILVVPKDLTSAQTKHNICLVCKEPGKLICCCGKGCKRSYHLSCFNPLLHDVPPGAWLCYFCVKKKMDLGAYSVSDGIESVWDVDEVLGMQNGKQYFVKYKGLAHVHNRWVPESELLHDAPSLLAIFGKNGLKEGNKWRKEWTEPERLLQKRLVAPLEVADELTSVSISEPLSCCVEWFVKWKGLEYDQATWELENSLLSYSSDSPMLIKDYENRRVQVSRSYDPLRADKALQVKRDPFCKMSKLPDECSVELDNDHLSSVNCLREFWYKSLNALFIDGQEHISKSILFVLSLQSHACRPSLIITTSGSLQLWQAGFLQLAPSVNVLIYRGDKDVRRMLQSLEFYDECGRLMFQVLLADPKAITEDLVNIACIGWESIIVDECQNSKIMRYLEQLITLHTDFKLVLFNGELKDSLSEHCLLLSFLDSEGTMDDGLVGLKAHSNDTPFALTKLKKKLARHIVFESKTDSPKFLEYWVPVPLSSVQLEQYCSTLVSNATVLRSNLKSDVVEALHNILITARKCCDHPYLVDGDLRGLLTKGLQGTEFLNAEVCASGKLYLLGKILQDMKDRGLRVVILFQSLGGPEKVFLGDVLDDFLAQRFGVDTYERIETGIVTTKKVAALKKFNDKETGKFVFLIEKRACLPSVKLHSVDAIILFNSDWNPLNDLRSLQKINIESQYKCTRVFRFYTSYTVEEKLLMLAKEAIILESCVENINRNIIHSLLGWGTSYLFQKLDHLHSSAKPASISEPSFDKLCLNDVIMEILTQFPGKIETSRAVPCSILTRAQLCGGTYSRNIVLAGEKKGISLPDKDLSSFWSGLLEGRRPKWMYISEHSQRVRRRIQNSNGLAIQAVEGDEAKSKRRKIDNNVDPVKLHEINEEKGDVPEENHKSGMLESEDGKQQLEDQRNLLMLLRPELSELCDILGQPESVKDMAQKFLLYIMTNHDVSTNRVTVLQALKISLCWRAASMSGHSLDLCGSLSVAKKQLKFECTDQEAYSVYSKLQILEEKFPCQTGALENLSVENIPDNQSPSKIVNDVREASDWRAMDTEATGNLTAGLADEFHFGNKASEQLISLQSHPLCESPPDFGSNNENPFKNQIDVIDKVFLQRSEDLAQRQLVELCNFHKQMNKNKLKLEETHELDLKLIRSIHIDERIRKDKINILRQEFPNKLGRFDQHRKQQKQKLVSMQLDLLKKEEELKYKWLEKAKTGVMDESVDAIPRSESGFRLENFLEDSEFTTNYRKSGATIFDFACPSDGTIIGCEGCLEVPSNILNEHEENVRPGDDTLASCALATGDDLEQIVQNRLSAATANCPGLSDVLPMNSGISAPQSEVLKPFCSCPADLINGSITVERFNFNQQECGADSNVQLVPNPQPKQAVLLSPVQGLTSYVPASTLSSTQGLCANKHTRPAETLTKDNNHDTDSAQEVTVTASDSVVNLSPHIEMMTCNDVARLNSTNIPLPQAEHEQERLPPTGYQEATPQPHHSVELSEIPGQQEIMNLAIESDPSNSQIPENAIQPLRPQEYLPSEGIASEHLVNTVIQYGRACDWSHSSTQQAEVMVQAAVSEGEPSIQQIPDPMRTHEDMQFERTHLEHLRSTNIQLDEPSQFFQNFSSMESVPPQAIYADPIRNELIRVRRRDISCTEQHEKKKLLLQSRREEEMEKVRRKYNILLQDAEKEYLQEKNILLKICQKICWHKAFAEDVSSNFYDHKKGSSTSFQVPSQNSSQHPQASAPVPLSTSFQPHPSQNTNLASTPHFLPISRPQASSTGLVNPRGILQTGPINLRPNLLVGRSPAPHLQRGRAPHASVSTFSTRVASVATLQPTPPSLVSTATPTVPPPNLASSFPAPFPFMDSNILSTFGTSQPAGFRTSPHYFGIPQSELPHYAGPDDSLLESLLADFPAAEAHAEAVIDSRPIASPDFIYFTDDD